MKIGIVTCLRWWTENIWADEETNIEEIKRLEDVFLGNEHPLKKRTQPALEMKISKRADKETDSRTLVLSYVKRLIEKITQVC